MTLFCSSGESNSARCVNSVLRHCSKRAGLWLSYRLAYTLTFCFLVLRQLCLAASHIKGTRRDGIHVTISRDRPQAGLAAGTCWSHAKADSSVGTVLFRLTDVVEIRTEQTKSLPQNHPLHSSAIPHPPIALCWLFLAHAFLPPTPPFRARLHTAATPSSLPFL